MAFNLISKIYSFSNSQLSFSTFEILEKKKLRIHIDVNGGEQDKRRDMIRLRNLPT